MGHQQRAEMRGPAVPGTWTGLATTAWDKDLPPTDLAVLDYPSWRRKLLDPVTKALHHSCGLVVFAPLCTPRQPSILNVVTRERMELVCNVFQSHDISSLIFNGHAYT